MIPQELVGKRLVFAIQHNPCCEGKYESQEELIKRKAKIATLYFVDEEDMDKVWGDDWDDEPACCNADSPSGNSVNNPIIKVDLFYGKSINIE